MGTFPAGGYAAELRIGTAEREQAASALAEHFSAGRLDTDEFDERVRQAYQARTAADLAVLFRDLPVPVAPPMQPRPAPRRTDRRMLWSLAYALLILGVLAFVVVAQMLPFFLFPLIWIGFARSHRHRPVRRW